MTARKPFPQSGIPRRKFVQGLGAAAVASSWAASPLPAGGFHHSVNDSLRVGLVGCGGRGTGAAINACNADPNVIVTAMADAFPDRLDSCWESLNESLQHRLVVPPEKRFSGVDCHLPLIASDVDVVILAQPPYFRPAALKACVEAGKHVFCEKPVGVDVPGVLSVMETCKNAKDVSIVSGLCWRYDLGVRATMDRIKDGALGQIITIQENYLTGELWHRGNRNWSPLEYQMRNWLYFTWLSGDIPLEQHIHSLDKAMWLMDDVPPARCYGTGGRQKRTAEKWGNVYDHFASCFEWENGVKCYSYCRQQNDCFNETEDHVYGTAGRAKILRNEIQNKEGVWKYSGPTPSMYDVEHEFLFKAIRSGEHINNGDYMSKSTLMAIMARNACYTGQMITWEDLLKDETRLGPTSFDTVDYTPDPVPIPGRRPS